MVQEISPKSTIRSSSSIGHLTCSASPVITTSNHHSKFTHLALPISSSCLSSCSSSSSSSSSLFSLFLFLSFLSPSLSSMVYPILSSLGRYKVKSTVKICSKRKKTRMRMRINKESRRRRRKRKKLYWWGWRCYEHDYLFLTTNFAPCLYLLSILRFLCSWLLWISFFLFPWSQLRWEMRSK